MLSNFGCILRSADDPYGYFVYEYTVTPDPTNSKAYLTVTVIQMGSDGREQNRQT